VPTITDVTQEAQLSQAARRRLRAPLRRGVFRDIDAARAQLGLLSVADDRGQARIYWLIDLNTQVVEDARFLAFGSLASHPVADRWSELVRGMSVEEACEIPLERIEADLRDDPDQAAFGEAGLEPLAFVHDLQQRALQALPGVRLLPKPKEVERYQRKREADWDEHDRDWLPLSLMKKVMRVQEVAAAAIADHIHHKVAWSIEGLHDDFRVVVDFSSEDPDAAVLPAEERPTVARMIEEALRGAIHPALRVEERT